MTKVRSCETVTPPPHPTPGQDQNWASSPIDSQNLVIFDPNHKAIRLANRVFLLSLNLREDGTGLARLSEVSAEDKTTFLVCAFKQTVDQEWVFNLDMWSGRDANPRAAASECLRKRHGLAKLT